MKKKAVVTVTPVLKYEGGEAKGQSATFQGEKVQGNDQTIAYKAGGTYTMKSIFDLFRLCSSPIFTCNSMQR